MSRRMAILLTISFVAVGGSVSLFALVLPYHATLLRDDKLAVSLIATRVVGAMVGSLLIGAVIDRLPVLSVYRSVLGCLVLSLAVQAVTASKWLLFVLYFSGGLATAGTLVAMNVVIVRQLLGAQRQSTLIRQQLVFGIGAACTPLVVFALAPSSASYARIGSLVLAGAGSLLLVPLLASVALRMPPALPPQQIVDGAAGSAARAQIGTPVTVALFAGTIFGYYGLENGFSNWAYVWAKNLPALTVDPVVLISLFWATLSIGRLAAVLLFTRHGPERLLRYLLVLGALSALALQVPALRLPGVLVLGAALGPIYPLLYALLSDRVKVTGMITGITMVSGSFGSLLISATIGSVILTYGSGALSYMLFAVFAAIALLMTIERTRFLRSRRN